MIEQSENEEQIVDTGNEEQENLAEDTKVLANEPNECVNERDHEDMNDEGHNEGLDCEYGPTNIDDPSN